MPVSKENVWLIAPWLIASADDLAACGGRARNPQALLVHGAPGSGRRALALWYAERLLGVRDGRLARYAQVEVGGDAGEGLGHPDFLFLQPPPEKASIPVEAVRELIEFLHLKSHQGGARVAVLWPADALTTAAANSLLKTLEEPPAGGYIVLVAATPAALPPTVVSRCQRLAVRVPERSLALEWLRTQAGEADWELLLDIAGGAPYRALALHGSDFGAQAARFGADVRDLEAGRESPVTVAQRWAGCDEELVAQWLYWMLARRVREAAERGERRDSADPRGKALQMAGKALNMQTLLARLADVEELRRIGSKAVKADLQYAAVLQRWYG